MSNGNILIVDDEVILQEVTSKILNHFGFESDCLSNGNEIVDYYKKSLEMNNPYNFIIIDLNIPNGIGGTDANNLLKAEFPDVKTVISSGNPTDDIIINYKLNNFDAVLIKPFTIENIQALLNEFELL